MTTMVLRRVCLAALWILVGCRGVPRGETRGPRGDAAVARPGQTQRGPARRRPQHEDDVRCPDAVLRWTERCASAQGFEISGAQCPERGLLLVDVGDAAPLRVEVRHSEQRSFRAVGAWGLSPVGEFPDWNGTDPRLRREFDQLEACVRADGTFGPALDAVVHAPPEDTDPNEAYEPEVPARMDPPVQLGLPARGPAPSRVAPTASRPTSSPAVRGPERSSPRTTTRRPFDRRWPRRVPWMLLGALGCMAALLRRRVRDPRWRLAALPSLAAAAATLLLRAVLLPTAYFHQNGQGPLWVAEIVASRHHPYGPGYRSLFGWLRWLTPNPDGAVFFVQGLLAAAAVPCVAFTARRLGARGALPWALALLLAVDPLVVRLARSESYYGVGLSLLFMATALLAAAVRAPRLRSEQFVLPVLAAGLVLAQAVTVHPVLWSAASLSPLVLVLAPGNLRRRLLRTLAASLIVGLVVAVLAGPSVLAVLHSSLGASWAPGASPTSSGDSSARRVLEVLSWLVLAALALGSSARTPVAGAVRAVVLVVVVIVLRAADLVGSGSTLPWIHAAYLHLYAPLLLALAVSALGERARGAVPSRAVPAAVAALGLLALLRLWPGWTVLPTDARELALMLRWRASIPVSARVGYIERIGDRILVLPFYHDGPGTGPRPLVLREHAFVEDLGRYGPETYYVRTSLCSTPEGRQYCDAFERRYALVPVHQASLPAIPSMVGFRYDRSTVAVGLYRVAGPSGTP